MLTFPDQRPHLHQPPGPYQEPHLSGVVVPTANHMAFLQDIKGLYCEPPSKMPYSAHSTFPTTDTSDVTGSPGSSAQEAGHQSPFICGCFCARTAVVTENHGLQSLKYVICTSIEIYWPHWELNGDRIGMTVLQPWRIEGCYSVTFSRI